MRHSQSFDKIDSFLKLVSNIFILRNLIVRLEGGGGGGVRLLRRGWYFASNHGDIGIISP